MPRAAAAAGVPPRRSGAVAAGAAVAAAGFAGAAALGGARAAAAPTSNTISGEPTATLSPGAPRDGETRPLTGAGTSTAALSVITSTIDLILGDHSARLGVPGDDLRLDRAFAQVRHLEDELAHAGSMTALMAIATRAWPGKYSHSKACG